MSKLFSVTITLEGNSFSDIEKQLLVMAGQLKSGDFVPEITIENPELLKDPMKTGEPFNFEGLGQ